MAINRTPQLEEERIEKLRAEIDAFIEERVEAEKIKCPGVPGPMIRKMITDRNPGCQCRQYLALKATDEANAESAARSATESAA